MTDLLEERARSMREELHWLIAASPLEPDQVKARYSELERSHTKVLRLDSFMEQKAAEKKAREEAAT
ncbi:MAG TPA: hypothetical protein VGU71_22570 [Candidatus Dormibacteraeota bacterium]|nr:hypothetical protein [Candidatus Dormibacteraeota bacterium]